VSIESHLNRLLETLAVEQPLNKERCQQMLGLIDLTLLDKAASSEALAAIEARALKYEVAAICFYPEHLPQDWPSACSVKRATVINFPAGQSPADQCLKDIQNASDLQAEEIDYVFNYEAYQRGSRTEALHMCETIIKACKDRGLTSKIILETGAFSSISSIYQLSKDIIPLGCDFLKTSTGKITQGASLSAGFAMLSAIADSGSHCGVKFSGGIKSPAQGLQYIALAEQMLGKRADPSWFRIGASSLLDELINSF